MAWPTSGAAEGGGRQRRALGHRQLQLDEVEAGHQLGDRVLDLQAGVHLQEPELAGRAEQELDGPGPDVADGPGGGDGGVGHPPAQRRRRRPATVTPRRSSGDGAGSSTPARAATTVLPVRVGEHLDLDVAPVLDVALAEHGAVAERGGRLPLGVGPGLVELVGRPHDAHAPPAAAGRGLDEHREADGGDVVGALDAGVGEHRHAGGPHQRLGLDLRAHRGDGLGRRADPRQPGVDHGAGERRRLGEEAVAGVDGIGAGPAGGVDQEVGAQVRVGRPPCPAGARRASQERTWSASASASLNTATVRMPSRRHVAAMRQAISPRLAMRRLWITSHVTSGTRRSRAGRGSRRCGWRTGRCRARCGCRGGR